MKKRMSLWVVYFTLICTAILAGCSCSKDKKPSSDATNPVSLTITNKDNVDNCYVIDGDSFAYVGSTIKLNYQIAPVTSTSNEVNVYLTGTTSAASVVTTTSNGVVGSVILNTLDKGVVTVTIETKSTPIRSDHFTFEVVAPTQLNSPTSLRYEDGYLVWNKVENAKSYSLVLSDNGIEGTPIEVSYDSNYPAGVRYLLQTGTIITGHEYTAKVKANGNGTTTADSQYSDACYFTKLDQVKELRQEDGILRFDAIPRATSYLIEIIYQNVTGYHEEVVEIQSEGQTELSYDLTNLFANAYTYQVRVRPKRTSLDPKFVYLEGDWSDSFEIIQLGKVTNFSINNAQHASVISWNAVKDAIGYEVVISNASGQKVRTVKVEDNAYTVEEDLGSGQYQLIVWAFGTDHAIRGQASSTFTFRKLESVSVSSVRLTGNLLSFASVIGAKSYEITYENETDCFTDVVHGNSSTIGTSITKPGRYHIGIRVMAKQDTGLNYANSNKIEFSDLVVEKLPNASIACVTNGGTKRQIEEGYDQVTEVMENWTNPTIHFNQVSHASSYTIYLAKEGQSPVIVDVITNLLSYTFSALQSGKYTAWVQANGTDQILSSTVVFEEDNVDAFSFTVLNPVMYDTIRLDDVTKSIQFGEVAGSSGYLVQENNENTYYFIGNSTSYVPKHLQEGSNTITIYPWGNGVNYVIGSGTNYAIQKLYAPQALVIKEGILTIQPNTNNGQLNNAVYELEVSVDGKVTQILRSNTHQVDLGSMLQPNVTYQLRARITEKGKLSSNYTQSLDVIVLSMSQVQVGQDQDKIMLTWDQVAHASGYEVIISKGDEVLEQSFVHTNSYKTTAIEDSGEYTATVRAVGSSVESGLGYLSSYNESALDFYRLACPTLSMSNGKLSWTSGDLNESVKASGYLLTFSNGQTQKVDGLSYVAHIDQGQYTVSIQALGDGQTVMGSVVSTEFQFIKLAQPTLDLHNGVLTIVDESIANGQSGTIYSLYQAISTNESINYVLVKDNITNTSTNLGAFLTQGVSYNLVVCVASSGYMTSNYDISQAKQVEKLARSTRFAITDATFHWQGVSHATGYTLKASKGMSYTKHFASSILQDSLPELQQSGEYAFALIAVGDSTKYVSSDEVTVDTYQLSEVTQLTTKDGKLVYTYQGKTLPVRYDLTIRQNEELFVVDNRKSLSFDFKDTNVRNYQGTYLVSVQAVGDGSATQSSKSSQVISVTKLDTPTNVAVGVTQPTQGLIRGQLQWPKPYGASSNLQYALLLNGQERTLIQCNGINDYEIADRVGYFFYEKDGYYYFTGTSLLQNGVENHIAIRCFDHQTNGMIDSEWTTSASVMALNAPKNIQVELSDEYSQATLVWDNVVGATKYAVYQVLDRDESTGMVMLNLRTDLGDKGIVSTNSCVIHNTDIESITHSLVIIAIGSNGKLISEGNTYWTSGISDIASYTTLGQITGLKVEQGIITWDLGNASKFKINVYDYKEGIEDSYLSENPIKTMNTYEDTAYALEDMRANGTYFVAIYPVGNSVTTLSNHVASTIKVKKMSTISNLRVVEGVLTWEMTYDHINAFFNYVDENGQERVFDLAQAQKLAELIQKQNNGQLSDTEKAFFESISQLATFEIGVAQVESNWSTIGQFAYQTLRVTGVEALEDRMILTYDDMHYHPENSMLAQSGYYQVKLRTIGNSGIASDAHDLVVSGDFAPKVLTVYRTPAVEQVEMGSGSEYKQSYIHHNHITFRKVPAVQNSHGVLTTQDIDYVIEFEYVNVNGQKTVQSYNLLASEIGNSQNGEISLDELFEKSNIKVNAGVVYFVRVRTRGTVDSTKLGENETIILKSAFSSTSRMQILSSATLGIASGELYWSRGASTNALGYELEVYSLTSKNDQVVDGMQPVINREYGQTIQEYEDLDTDFSKYGLTHGWYAIRIRSLGNGSEYITGDWSTFQKVYRLPNVVGKGSEIILKDGDIAWTPSYSDANVTAKTASKVMVYQSSTVQGGYQCDYGEFTIVEHQDMSQRKMILGDRYPRMVGGVVQYYKAAIANMVQDNDQPQEEYLYLRSDYTLMEKGYSRLDAPTALRVENGQIVWDATGTGFEVMISGQPLSNQVIITPTNSNSFSLDLDSRFVAGTYEISVRNVADSVTQYLSSTFSEKLTVTKYKAPDLRLEKGHIVWNTSSFTAEEEASIGTVDVSILDGQEVVYHDVFDYSVSSLDLNQIMTEDGLHLSANITYTITVKYKVHEFNTKYLNGEMASMNFSILPSTELFADSKSNNEGVDNYVAWQATNGAKGYVAYIYDKQADGTFVYLSQDEVKIENVDTSDRFEYDSTRNVFTYKVPRLEDKIYRVYIEAMGDTILASENHHQGLMASSLIVLEGSYMDIELPSCPEVNTKELEQSYDGYICWNNVTVSAYPVIEYSYRKNPGEAISDSVIVKLPKNTTEYYLPTIAGEYFVKLYAQNDLGANSDVVNFKTSFTIYNDGDGTKENAYQINNATQFSAMRKRANLTNWLEEDGVVHFVLTNDILLENTYTTIEQFNANLNGVNTDNKRYHITLPSAFSGSLFGTIGESASVTNILLSQNITLSKSRYSVVADQNNGSISNLDLDLSGTFKVNNFAGLVMNNKGVIANIQLSLSDITINPLSSSGVLYASMITQENEGVVEQVTINGSAKLNANTSGETMMAGVAYTNSHIVRYITNYAQLKVSTGTRDYTSILAGLVAYNLATVEYSGVNATLTGNIVGGLVYNNYATIDNCYFVGNIVGTRLNNNSSIPFSIGGLVVSNQNTYYQGMEDIATTPVIRNCYVVMKEGITIKTNSASVGAGYARVGGLVVNNNVNKSQTDATISNCYVAIEKIQADMSGYYFGIIAYSSMAKNNEYPVFSNVYYYKGISHNTLIHQYDGSQTITTNNNALGFVGVASYHTMDEMTGLRPMYKEVTWCDWVVLDWQTKI